MTPSTQQPRVISCHGASAESRLAEEVAGELASLGVADTDAGDDDRETIVIDGCASACGLRHASAQGVHLIAAVNLSELGAHETAAPAPGSLAAKVTSLLRRPPALARPARPHRPGRARPQPPGQSHTAEDYLLAIDRLASPAVECGAVITDSPTLAAHVSETLGISRPTAGEMLAKLETAGLVLRGARKELLLTPAGRAAADASVRRHRLLEVFATEWLGYEPAEAYAVARRLSASFDDDAITRLEESLDRPGRCPHGWPVDPVRAREEIHELRTLTSLAPGESAQVARLAEDDEEALRLLAAHGLAPGADVTVTGPVAAGRLLVECGDTTILVDELTARSVFVRS